MANRSSLDVDWTRLSLQTPPPSRSPGPEERGEGHVTAQGLSCGYTCVCVCVCVYLEHRSWQDDVSTQRTLRVEALLPAVLSLSQRHGQGRLRVHLQGHRWDVSSSSPAKLMAHSFYVLQQLWELLQTPSDGCEVWRLQRYRTDNSCLCVNWACLPGLPVTWLQLWHVTLTLKLLRHVWVPAVA